jgi:hypothetical protein
MNLFQTCIRGDVSESIKELRKLVTTGQPAALWAIMMHASAWHEQQEFDTPHSVIMTYSIHRMIEELGPNPKILIDGSSDLKVDLPEEFREHLQLVLLQRLTVNLASVDHWMSDKGPRYDYKPKTDSLDNVMHAYVQSIRERSHMSALQDATTLANEENPIRFIRRTVAIAAEKADNLGHAFIMPMSLVVELPAPKFTFPHRAGLWHLTEYLVRKIPANKPDGLPSEKDFRKLAKPTNLQEHDGLFASAAVHYGVLGHNIIFAHRIAEAARTGLISSETTNWLLEQLKQNTGSDAHSEDKIDIESLMDENVGTDWDSSPTQIELPHAQRVREWLSVNTNGYWERMTDLKSEVFEVSIPRITDEEWKFIRTSQYAMCSLYGTNTDSHIIIFTQAIWSLVDMGLIPRTLAALQCHRMLRQYLKDK